MSGNTDTKLQLHISSFDRVTVLNVQLLVYEVNVYMVQVLIIITSNASYVFVDILMSLY